MPLVLLMIGLIACAIAQESGQAALPPCILNNCEATATKASGCADTDIYCHCTNQAPIYKSILPCIQEYCTDPNASLIEYNRLFGGACSQYNITVPAQGINTTVFSSITPVNSTVISFTPSPTISTADGSSTNLPSLKLFSLGIVIAFSQMF